MTQNFLEILKSGSDEQILQALKECRISGSNVLIGELMKLLEKTHNELVHKEVAGILNDLNDQSSADELMHHLPSYKSHSIFPELIGACWQNNLDYSAYIDFFIDVVLESDFASALEAYTVVENNITRIENKKREEMSEKIAQSKSDVSPEKARLVEELYATVKMFYGPFRLDLS